MNACRKKVEQGAYLRRGEVIGVLSLLMILLLCATSEADAKKISHARTVAKFVLISDLNEASAEYWLAGAIAENMTSKEDRKDAVEEAKDQFKESVEDARDQRNARVDLAKALGEDRYDPEIDPTNFLTPAETAAHPNPFMPLVPGTTRVYQSTNDAGTEIVSVEVTHDTREILGVTCIVVHDVATLNGVVVEDTFDWFAQDVNSNVWYFGEQSVEYENGKIVSIDGSWEAGEDGALPGIIMKGNPMVGDIYRQEYALGEAEDVGEVLSLTASESVPYGAFSNCLQTEDSTPMEPDHLEHKFFAPGVGEILAISVTSGHREELISITP